MSGICPDPDNIICEGINGLKSLITPLIPGVGDATSTSTTTTSTSTTTTPTSDSATVTTPSGLPTSPAPQPVAEPSSATATAPDTPPPPPTPQPIAETSTTTEIMTSTSVVVAGGGSSPQSFITDLPTAFTSIPGALPTSTVSPSTLSDISQPTPTPAASASPEGAAPVVVQSQGFPTVLVVALSSTAALLAISGIALWYFCLRKRLRSRAAVDYGARDSVNEIYRATEIYRSSNKADSTDGTIRPSMVFGNAPSTLQWAEQNRPMSWQPRAPSIHTLAESRNSFDDMESNFPEPLSPRPVMQQTVQRVSVPRPVEASSFRSGSRGSSIGGSSDTSNSYNVRQVVLKGPAPGVAHSRPPSAYAQAKPKLTLVKVPGSGAVDLKSVNSRKPVASDAKNVTSATSVEVPVGLIPERPSSGQSDQTSVLQRHYTVRRSPLAQNPFTDPSDEDWQGPSEAHDSIISPTLRIVNPDILEEIQGEEKSEPPVDEKTEVVEREQEQQQPDVHETLLEDLKEDENEDEKEHEKEGEEGDEEEDEEELDSQQAPLERVASTPPVIPAIPEQRFSFLTPVKRVSFAKNS